MKKEKPWIVALTGASGVVYGRELLCRLARAGERIVLLISPEAELVMAEELGLKVKKPQSAEWIEKLLAKPLRGQVVFYPAHDITAPPASGSFLTKGMVVCPCSMASVSAIRTGASRGLIDRAADVILKESRRLILVPREMPMSPIHLENLYELSRIGVRVLPAMPGFYHRPKTLQDMVDFVVGKVMDAMEVEHSVFPRWNGQ